MLRVLLGLSFLFTTQLSYADSCSEYTDLYNDSSKYMSEKLLIDGVEFNLHYAKNKKQTSFTRKTISTLEIEVKKIHNYFGYKPQGGVHIRIPGFAQMSNGSAQTIPYNIIELYDYAPEEHSYLGLTKDWIKNLIIHEYVHIVTLDMTSGWVDTARSVFGGIIKPTGVAPRWLSEGVATWWESLEPEQGRLNQKIIKWETYKALSNPNFCDSVSCLDSPKTYPYGHAAYWVGGFFLKYLEEQKPGFLKCLYNENSGSVPFRIDTMFIRCRSTKVHHAYSEFRKNFLETNKDLKNYCPVNSKFCEMDKEKLLNANLDAGYCETENELIYIDKRFEGRTRKNTNHELKILNLSEKTIKTYSHDYPIYNIKKINNKCVVKEIHYGKCAKKNDFILKEFNSKTFKLTKIDNERKNEEKATAFNQEKDQEYNGGKYLTPKFFLFTSSTYEGLTSLDAFTSISDPLNIHSIGAAVAAVTHKGESYQGGELSYTYRKGFWAISGFHLTRYSYNSFYEDISLTKSTGSNFEVNIANKNWFLQNNYNYSQNEQRDFLSKKEYKKGSISVLMGKKDSSLTKVVKKFNILFDLSGYEFEKPFTSRYLGGEIITKSEFYLTDRSILKFDLNLGKLNKTTNTDGVIKGGGSDSFNGTYRYPLYMFSYGDMFGNDVISGRFELSSSLLDMYYGDDMFPFFNKDLGAFIGSEYAKAKYFYFGDDLIKNEYATSAYAGLFLNNLIAYRWDTSLKVIFSRTMHPRVDDRFMFLIDAAEFF